MQNQAFYMTGLNKMEAREIPMPSVASDQVIIKIEYVGICGSDSHYLEFGRIGSYVVEGDFILGHECAGTIVEVGSQVTSLKVGDRVALEPGVTCGRCFFCKSGKYNLCPDVQFLATPPYNGCLMNYMAFPAHMCFKLPQNVSTREGALVEPLSVGMHAANQGHVRTGDNVVILGSGCIGLVTLMSCKASGAGKVTVVDIMPKRLEFAKKLGADFTVDSSKEDIIQFAQNLNDGAGPDVVIETAGSEITIQQSPYLVRRGGRIVLVGLAAKDRIPFDFSQIMWKEASVSTVFRYRNIYPSAIEAIASGAINVAGIITHEFGFDETPKAFEYASKNKNEVVKAVIKL
jgi:L-iditol 2-dehydrogenase